MLVTLLGISIEVKPLQYSKAQKSENHDYMIMMIEKWRGGG